MKKKIKIGAKEFQAEINRAYLQGYRMGMAEGRREAISEKLTPNLIREYLGMAPIEKIEKEVTG